MFEGFGVFIDGDYDNVGKGGKEDRVFELNGVLVMCRVA